MRVVCHGRSLWDDMFYSEVGESLRSVGNLPYSGGRQLFYCFTHEMELFVPSFELRFARQFNAASSPRLKEQLNHPAMINYENYSLDVVVSAGHQLCTG